MSEQLFRQNERIKAMTTDADVTGPRGSCGACDPPQVFRREGEYWTIVYDGRTIRLRDGRGLQHLAVLLASPHTNVSALELERRALEVAPPSAPATVGLHDARERARVNVTRAISATLKRIAAHHADLARHLETTIRTGVFCTYTPDPRALIEWER